MGRSDSMCGLSFHTGLMGGRLHRALPSQHVSFSANQGILAQLEWKYMQGKGVFNLILWGRGWRGIKFSHFFFFNDVLARVIPEEN